MKFLCEKNPFLVTSYERCGRWQHNCLRRLLKLLIFLLESPEKIPADENALLEEILKSDDAPEQFDEENDPALTDALPEDEEFIGFNDEDDEELHPEQEDETNEEGNPIEEEAMNFE